MREWLSRMAGVLVAPRATLAAVAHGRQGGVGDVVLLMLLFLLGTAPLEVARVLLASDHGVGLVLSRLLDMFIRFSLLPLAVCLIIGLTLVGTTRWRHRPASVEGTVAAATYLWVPVGALGLVGEVGLLLGVNAPVFPHVPLVFFLGASPSWWEILLRLAVSYGWSMGLAWVLLGVLRAAPDAIPQARPPAWGAWLLLAILALSYGAGAIASARRYDVIRPVRAGDPAVGFALPRADGQGALSLEALRGSPVVIEFWATWCTNCVSAMPHLDAWAAAHPQIKVLGVHAGGSPGEVGSFVANKDWRHVVILVDATEQVAAAYRVDTYPTVFGIAPDGTVTAVQVGTASSAWLEAVSASATPPGP